MPSLKNHENERLLCQSDLLDQTAINLKMPRSKVKKVVQAYLDNLENQILLGDRITIKGLGVFYRTEALDARNFTSTVLKKGKYIEHRSIKFKASNTLKQRAIDLAKLE